MRRSVSLLLLACVLGCGGGAVPSVTANVTMFPESERLSPKIYRAE